MDKQAAQIIHLIFIVMALLVLQATIAILLTASMVIAQAAAVLQVVAIAYMGTIVMEQLAPLHFPVIQVHASITHAKALALDCWDGLFS